MISLEEYLEALASSAPTPGGGSAATIVGATAAALVAMVARITAANAKFAALVHEASDIVTIADELHSKLLQARATDEAAYGSVVTAMALPRHTDAEKQERASALQAALKRAAEAPMVAAKHARAVLHFTSRARALGNTSLMSDIDCAEIFARASFEASLINVRVNHEYIKDAEFVAGQEETLLDLERNVKATFPAKP